MSSVAVMLHLVGTNFLFSWIPKFPTENNLMRKFSSKPFLCRYTNASFAFQSVSSTAFSTDLETNGFEVIDACFNLPAGPNGAVSRSNDHLNDGAFSKLISMSTGLEAIPTSLLISSILLFLSFTYAGNLEFTSEALNLTISGICRSLSAQAKGASYISGLSTFSGGANIP